MHFHVFNTSIVKRTHTLWHFHAQTFFFFFLNAIEYSGGEQQEKCYLESVVFVRRKQQWDKQDWKLVAKLFSMCKV